MNVYQIAKINGEVVDLAEVKSIMVHGSKNWEKAEGMLKRGMAIEEVGEYFCPNCGNFKPNKNDCNCIKD